MKAALEELRLANQSLGKAHSALDYPSDGQHPLAPVVDAIGALHHDLRAVVLAVLAVAEVNATTHGM